MNKESFILFTEQKEVFESLSDEQAGQLIKAIFNYIDTGQIPQLELTLKMAFIPIRQNLDRNNEKWEDIKQKRSEAGKLGAEIKKQKQANQANANFAKNEKANQAVNVNDNVNVNVNGNVNDKYIASEVETSPAKMRTPRNKAEEKEHFAEFVTMTNDEYNKLVVAYSKEFADQCITVLDNYKGASGKRYKSDYRAILNWVIDRVKKDYKTPIKEPNTEVEDYSKMEWNESHPLYDFAYEDGGYDRAIAQNPNKKICKGDERFG